MIFPLLETERLLLRPWREHDAEDLFEYSSDLEVSRTAMWRPDTTIEETKAGILHEREHFGEKQLHTYLGIELKSESKLIGSVGFPQWNMFDRRAELGFALNRKYWGQGLMTEAVRRAIEFGWEEMDLHRIEARTIVINAPSITILTKCGFERDGRMREAAFIDGAFYDVVHWGLLRAEPSLT